MWAIIFAIAAIIAILGWRGVRREQRRVAAALKQAEAAVQKRPPASITLEKDPETGVYRPSKRG